MPLAGSSPIKLKTKVKRPGGLFASLGCIYINERKIFVK
jgi:hypothetical protein